MRRASAMIAAGAILLAAGCKGQGDTGWQRGGRQPGGRPGATDAGGDETQRDARAGVNTEAVEQIEGTIEEARPDAIVVASPHVGRRTLRIGSATSLRREDQQITARELRPGLDVRASYREAGNAPELQALSIQVLPHRDRREMNGTDTSTVRDVGGGGAHGAQGGAPGAPGAANPGAPSPIR